MYYSWPDAVKVPGGDPSATTLQCGRVSFPVESSGKISRTFLFPKTNWSSVIDGAVARANNNFSSSVRSSRKISRSFVSLLSKRQSSSVVAYRKSLSAEPRFFSIQGSFIQKEAPLLSHICALVSSELFRIGSDGQIALSDRLPHIDFIEHS